MIRALLILLVISLAGLVACEGVAITPGQASKDLTADEFTSVVFTKPTLVKFFSPYCGHCRQLAPTWEEAAELIHREHPNVQLVGLDCTKFGDVCNKFGVRGYPTIKFIRPEESDAQLLALGQSKADTANDGLTRFSFEYTGARSVLAFEQFVTDPAKWQSAKKEDYPLPLPSKPVPPTMASHSDLQAARHAVTDKVAAARDTVKESVLVAALPIPTVAGMGELPQSNVILNALLVIAMLLVGAVGYWLYLTAKLRLTKPGKHT